MENSNLYTILDQIENYSIFDIKRKIKSLTDGAQIEHLFDLKVEVYRYLKHKFIQLYPDKVNKPGYNSNFLDQRLFDRNLRLSSFNYNTDIENSLFWDKLKQSIDLFWRTNCISQIESEVQKIRDFTIELDQLIIEHLNLENTKAENQIQNETEEVYDLSDTKIVEKLIYLKELGIIEYMLQSQPFSYSINKFATVLSAITGEKPNSIQPALNALIMDKGLVNKNNPYYNANNSIKVKQRLLDIGYEILRDIKNQ
jgi:hypothetical protein